MKKEIKVGIDATPLAGTLTGIGRYVSAIIRKMESSDTTINLHLYSPRPIKHPPPFPHNQRVIPPRGLPSSYLWLKTYVKEAAERDGIDVFWATRTLLPSPSKLFQTVSTVHDLNTFVCPGTMPPITRWAHRIWFVRDLRRCGFVIANSEGTAARLRTFTGITSDDVIKPGVSRVFYRRDDNTVEALKRVVGITGNYFLVVGTLEPRKNVGLAIDAFLLFKEKTGDKAHQLVLVGSKGWKNRPLIRRIKDLERQGIIWLGRVDDEELATLYSGATALVFPSIYEGFGIPLVEARACGCPVIATDIPELKEAGGRNGIYVELNPQSFSSAMAMSLNSRKAHDLQPIPSWKYAARRMVAIFNRLA